LSAVAGLCALRIVARKKRRGERGSFNKSLPPAKKKENSLEPVAEK